MKKPSKAQHAARQAQIDEVLGCCMDFRLAIGVWIFADRDGIFMLGTYVMEPHG